jgi:hypothetical protein
MILIGCHISHSLFVPNVTSYHDVARVCVVHSFNVLVVLFRIMLVWFVLSTLDMTLFPSRYTLYVLRCV